MRDPTSGSASAGDSDDQGTDLQNFGKSKGKGPDPELYTSVQLSELRAQRRYQPDVASETLDQRVLNIPQNLNLPGSQLSGVNNVDSAPKASAVASTPNTNQRAELPCSQLPGNRLHGSSLPGSHLSGVDNVDSASKASAIGSAMNTHQRAELLHTQLPGSQLPPSQLPSSQLSGVDNVDSVSKANAIVDILNTHHTAERTRTQLPRSRLPRSQLPRRQLHGSPRPDGQVSAVDNVNSASTTVTMGTTRNTHQIPKLPGSQLLGRQSPDVDIVDAAPQTSTMESTVKKYRDFYNTKAEDSRILLQRKRYHPAEVHRESRKNARGTSQSKAASSQLGFGIDKNHSASSSTNSLTVKPLNIVKKRGPQQFAANPPQAPLPLLPTRRSQPLGLQAGPSSSYNAAESSLASTYGDTASLLNLSVQEDVNINESGASGENSIIEPVKGKASSIAGTGNIHASAQSSNGLLTPPNEIRFRPSSTLNTSNRSSGRVSIVDSNGSLHSRPLSVQETGVLERHINAALRRMGCLSADSDRFSIPASHQEPRSSSAYGIQTSNPSGELNLDVGPGRSQSASSHGPLSQSASGHSNGVGFKFLSRYCSSGCSSEEAAALRMWADYMCDEGSATSPAGETDAVESRGEGRVIGEMDEEGDIVVRSETVEENRRLPRQTHFYTLARLTGSSVAGFSSSAEGSEDGGMPRSPSLERSRRRYPESSTLERNGQSGDLILRPEYTFTGGAGFPHRDAFTPSQANLFPNNRYQHPTPLTRDHVHPFRSSPPLIDRAGASQHSYTRSPTSDYSLPFGDGEHYILQTDMYSGPNMQLRADTYPNSDMRLRADTFSNANMQLRTNTYSSPGTYLQPNTYSPPDQYLRADTYSSRDMYLQPNTYSRPDQYSRATYTRRSRGVYQPEVDENLASGSGSNGGVVRYNQRDARFVNHAAADALDGFYPSSSRSRTRGEGYNVARDYEEFIQRNGSLVTMMGRQSIPQVNRIPMRTVMRDDENRLAVQGNSSTQFRTYPAEPYLLKYENFDEPQSTENTQQEWVKSNSHSSSSPDVGRRVPQLYEPYRETSWNFSSPREYGLTHDILREHRRQLAVANLLPRAFTPPTPQRHLTPLHLASLIFQPTPSGGSSIRAVGPVGPSGGPAFGLRTERRRFVPAPHLIPNRRPSAAVLNRRRILGAVTITVMGVCPPLLLIVGLGGMDAAMTSVMRGEVEGFTEAQKRVALGLGVGSTLGVLLGAIGAIIYLMLH